MQVFLKHQHLSPHGFCGQSPGSSPLKATVRGVAAPPGTTGLEPRSRLLGAVGRTWCLAGFWASVPGAFGLRPPSLLATWAAPRGSSHWLAGEKAQESGSAATLTCSLETCLRSDPHNLLFSFEEAVGVSAARFEGWVDLNRTSAVWLCRAFLYYLLFSRTVLFLPSLLVWGGALLFLLSFHLPIFPE